MISFHVPEAMKELAERYAESRGVTVSDVVREALGRFLQRNWREPDSVDVDKTKLCEPANVSFHDTEEVLRVVKRVAAKSGVTVSDVVRRAIAEMLREYGYSGGDHGGQCGWEASCGRVAMERARRLAEYISQRGGYATFRELISHMSRLEDGSRLSNRVFYALRGCAKQLGVSWCYITPYFAVYYTDRNAVVKRMSFGSITVDFAELARALSEHIESYVSRTVSIRPRALVDRAVRASSGNPGYIVTILLNPILRNIFANLGVKYTMWRGRDMKYILTRGDAEKLLESLRNGVKLYMICRP